MEVVNPPQEAKFDYVKHNAEGQELSFGLRAPIIEEYEASFGKTVRQKFNVKRALEEERRVFEYVVYDNCVELSPTQLIDAVNIYIKARPMRCVYVHHDKGLDIEHPHWHIRLYSAECNSIMRVSVDISRFSSIYIPPFMWAYPRKYTGTKPADNYEPYTEYLTHCSIDNKTTYMWSDIKGDRELIASAEKWSEELKQLKHVRKNNGVNVNEQVGELMRYLMEQVNAGIANPLTELTNYALDNGYMNTLKNYFNVFKTVAQENKSFMAMAKRVQNNVQEREDLRNAIREKAHKDWEKVHIEQISFK